MLALALFPCAVRPVDAQPGAKTPRIGLLSTGTDPSRPLPPQWVAFFDGMRALGWVEGKNIAVERRFAAGKSERVPAFATELAQLGVGEKYLERLKEAVPSVTRAAILASRQQRPVLLEEMQGAARALKVVLSPPILVREVADLEPAFARTAREGTTGLILPNDAFTVLHRQAIVALATKYRLPTISAFREIVEAGVLMAYGPSFSERFRQATTFVDKILKGAKPADLPVEQPLRFELVVNLKTAKALGLTIPPSLLLRADQVIDQ